MSSTAVSAKVTVNLMGNGTPKNIGVRPTKRGLLAKGSKPVGIGGRPQLAEDTNYFVGEDGELYETRLPVTEKTRVVSRAEQRARAEAAGQRKRQKNAERAQAARWSRWSEA